MDKIELKNLIENPVNKDFIEEAPIDLRNRLNMFLTDSEHVYDFDEDEDEKQDTIDNFEETGDELWLSDYADDGPYDECHYKGGMYKISNLKFYTGELNWELFGKDVRLTMVLSGDEIVFIGYSED